MLCRYVNSLRIINNKSAFPGNDGWYFFNEGALAPLLYSLVSLCTAILLPDNGRSSVGGKAANLLLSIISSPRNLWVVSHWIFGIAMLGTFFVQSALGIVFLFSMVGVSWAITCRVPYSLLGDELSRPAVTRSRSWGEEEDLSNGQGGLIYGIHNLAICLPQIIIMSAMGIVWMCAETTGGSSLDVVWFLRAGGVFALVASYFTAGLDQRAHYGEEDIGGACLA
jgi:solute carrier family 45, member 1/2/4